MDNRDTRVARFGTFEADPVARELIRAGRRINLQDQPFRLLLLLIEHPGEVVSREDIRLELWGETFVDFEEGLNTAVRKLREALGDSASNPRFIETLPRRGYRFIAPVERASATPQMTVQPQPVPLVAAAKSRWYWLAGGGALLVVVMLTAWFGLNRDGVSTTPSPPKQLTRDSGLTTDPSISRDGKLLVFASDRGGRDSLDVWIQQLPGGAARRLTDGLSNNYEPDISPDGSEVAFRSDRDGGGIYVVSSLGGEAKLLMKGDAFLPRYSPDGTQLAYGKGTFGSGNFMGNIHIYTRAIGSHRMLAPNVFVAGSVAWSLDGKYIAFAAATGIGAPIYLWMCPVDSGVATKLRQTPLEGGQPQMGNITISSVAWFQNQLIVSARNGDSFNLWTFPVTPGLPTPAGELRPITLGSGNELQPTVSAHGKLIFANHNASSAIWLATLNKERKFNAPQRLTDDRSQNYRPSITADGTKMAYLSNRTGTFEVWIRNLNTGQESALTSTKHGLQNVAISHDGSKVCYWDGAGGATYSVSLSGADLRQLCQNCGRVDDWTLDGKPIFAYSMKIMDLRSGETVQIVTHPALTVTAPRISRDGKWFAFHSSEFKNVDKDGVRGKRQVFIVPFNGQSVPASSWVAVTDGNAMDREAGWSPDGNRIYFLSDRDGARCIWARDLDPKSKQPIGEIYPVLHLHSSRLSLSHVPNTGLISISTMTDKLVFAMGELTGNLWMTELTK